MKIRTYKNIKIIYEKEEEFEKTKTIIDKNQDFIEFLLGKIIILKNKNIEEQIKEALYGQFSWKLRQDPRVVCLEKTNVRYITAEQIPEPIEFAGCDVSFISLTKVLPPVRELLADGADMVCLIKPQFEAGREKVGKKGVVRDPDVHREVIGSVIGFAAGHGFSVAELSFSPIRGPEGNIEYLVRLVKSEAPETAEGVDIDSTVRAAHDHDWGAAAH